MTLAVVLGGADCLQNDYDALCRMRLPDEVIAVNDAGIVTPHIDHWVTGHPEELDWRERQRADNRYPLDTYETWTRPYPHGMKYRERTCDHTLSGWNNGSSGFLAVGVASEIGADRVVLCGVPMDARPHFNRGANWTGHSSYREAWTERADSMQHVRSMSGWTRRLLGAPTPEWLRLVA